MCAFRTLSHWRISMAIWPVLVSRGMLTNSRCPQQMPSSQCPGDIVHERIRGARTRPLGLRKDSGRTVISSGELCEVICRGIAAPTKADLSDRFSTLNMCPGRMADLCVACGAATGAVDIIETHMTQFKNKIVPLCMNCVIVLCRCVCV